MPGKGVGLGDLGNGTAACETVCAPPKEIISPLFGLKDWLICRKRGYLCSSMKFHCFQHKKTLLFQIYTAMKAWFWEIIDFWSQNILTLSSVNIGVMLIYPRLKIHLFIILFLFFKLAVLLIQVIWQEDRIFPLQFLLLWSLLFPVFLCI